MAPLDATIQYLDWALLAAHEGASPDCRTVTLKLNLVTKTATTSFTKKDAPEGAYDDRILIGCLDAVFANLTGAKPDHQKCVDLIRNRLKEYRGQK